VLKTAAIQQQRELGLDEQTGGEYFTYDFILPAHNLLTRIEVDKPEADEVFDHDDMTHAKVVGDITAPQRAYVFSHIRNPVEH
jgi:hypothetical protein